MSRTLAREAAFKALFQLEFNHGEVDERETFENLAIETAIDDSLNFGKLNKKNLQYIQDTVKNVRARVDEIDEVIKAHLREDWALNRIAAVDRNILRLAVYELKFAEEEVPIGVIINEAVNLAKRYGTDDSWRFVNGILDAIAN